MKYRAQRLAACTSCALVRHCVLLLTASRMAVGHVRTQDTGPQNIIGNLQLRRRSWNRAIIVLSQHCIVDVSLQSEAA